MRHKRILLIEDDVEYRELLSEALKSHGFGHELQIEHDVESALMFLETGQLAVPPSLPDLILVDLRVSKAIELIRRLRESSVKVSIPLVRLIPSDHPYDLMSCYAIEANSYVVKPDSFEELTTLAGDLCRYWLRWNRRLSLNMT